jgi:arginyl-tRNA synthetase
MLIKSVFVFEVENGQHAHFKQLVRSLSRLGHRWADNMDDLHVKFGRVEGMSTRRGQVVLLRDILDEAKFHMLETMKAKSSRHESVFFLSISFSFNWSNVKAEPVLVSQISFKC